MSRSYLHTKYVPEYITWASYKNKEERNPHHLDEMPRNNPSKFITTHCSAYVNWLQDATSYGGHSRQKGGHRKVSGLVRASLKVENRRLVQAQLELI